MTDIERRVLVSGLAVVFAGVHDGTMNLLGARRIPTVAASHASDADIVWETTPAEGAKPAWGACPTGAATPVIERATFGRVARTGSSLAGRVVRRLATILTSPTFAQLHGRSPMETSRIAGTTVADAADVLERSDEVEWGHGRASGTLLLGSFHVASKELGRPRIADGVLYGHGFRKLRVTIAIYKYGRDRCSIQIRPRYRRPRTSRRLRHCLRSTHGAADRLRELALTVNFMPPADGPASELA